MNITKCHSGHGRGQSFAEDSTGFMEHGAFALKGMALSEFFEPWIIHLVFMSMMEECNLQPVAGLAEGM